MVKNNSSVDAATDEHSISLDFYAGHRSGGMFGRSLTIVLPDGNDITFTWADDGKLFYNVHDGRLDTYAFAKDHESYKMKYRKGKITEIIVPDLLREMDVWQEGKKTGIPLPDDQMKEGVDSCSQHKTYGGKQKPRNDCDECWQLYFRKNPMKVGKVERPKSE